MLEIACGTGYWTRRIAPIAASWLATDASGAMLAEARRNCATLPDLSFRRLDAFALPADLGDPGPFDALFAGFFWSHVRRAALPGFLASLAAALPGARFVFVDNRFVAGSSTPLSRTDSDGDTHQRRTLADGSTHEVLKNFPAAAEIHRSLAALTSAFHVVELPYYWLAWGRFVSPPPWPLPGCRSGGPS